MRNKLDEINTRLGAASEKRFPGRRVVYGDGDAASKIMLIGEAPGGDEEKQGKPFVGRAGKNLMDFLSAIDLERKDIYLTNVVKIRPFRLSERTGKPVNRPPNKEETAFFAPYLYEEIEAVKPEMIVTLGNVPLKAVLRDEGALIGECHGRLICFGESRVFPLYHPAAVIYNRGLESVYYGDIKRLKTIFNLGGR